MSWTDALDAERRRRATLAEQEATQRSAEAERQEVLRAHWAPYEAEFADLACRFRSRLVADGLRKGSERVRLVRQPVPMFGKKFADVSVVVIPWAAVVKVVPDAWLVRDLVVARDIPPTLALGGPAARPNRSGPLKVPITHEEYVTALASKERVVGARDFFDDPSTRAHPPEAPLERLQSALAKWAVDHWPTFSLIDGSACARAPRARQAGFGCYGT